MDADIATQSLGLASNTDFSLISLFLRADIIVKSVIIILKGLIQAKDLFNQKK